MKTFDLKKDNINKLILAFSIPCVISMLINSVYNIVDQIFIGQGVGTLGNAATNVIFPLVILFNAIAGLIGNGTAANMSLKLGEGKKEEARKSVGSAITIIIISSVIISIIAYILLPKLVMFFGCTKSVYDYAIEYGKIIILGAPFMIIYSALSSIIRADGSPKYSMILLVIGAIINIILDPIMIFTFNMGVKGGALATIIGQFVSFILAIIYLNKTKSFKLTKKDFIPNKTIFKVMGLGLSSFITQMTVLVLFVFMNNILTSLGAATKYGSDIPLSVYGVVSKINSLFISSVLGIAIGSQPIIGYNYGAGEYKRVKETLKKVLIINFTIAFIFNLAFFIFPNYIVLPFIKVSDPNYDLFIEFAVLLCRTFMAVITLNALEMTTSIVVQSLGKVFKATIVSFIRQIILLIPISLTLSYVFNLGLNGALYAGMISDILCFIICIFIFKSVYKELEVTDRKVEEDNLEENTYNGKHIVITISREYGSGGRYVGKLLADSLGIDFYDKELIRLTSEKSGLKEEYIEKKDQTKEQLYENNNDDIIFITEEKIIKKLAKKSCVIVGRCADYILKDNKDTLKVFLYSSDKNKIKRAVKYYNLDPTKAEKEISRINKERSKHYKFYTGRNWMDESNYDVMINVDEIGIDLTVDLLKQIVEKRG